VREDGQSAVKKMGQLALHKHADPSLQGGLAPAPGRRAFAAAFAASGGKARHRPEASTMVGSAFPAPFDAADLSRRGRRAGFDLGRDSSGCIYTENWYRQTTPGRDSVSSFGGGAAGDVSVAVANRLQIGQGTGIFADAGAPNSISAGDVTVAAGSLDVAGGGEISGSTSGSGKGGEISVRESRSRAQKGISGIVSINGITPLNRALVALSSELRKPAALTRNSCAERRRRPRCQVEQAARLTPARCRC
jgi:hypothetical protein